MIKNSDPIQNREEETMKKRLLAFLLAVCTAFSMLVLPASASGSNAAVQTAITLGALTPDQTANLAAPLTRGQFARMLTAFSAQRNSVNTQNATGRMVYLPEEMLFVKFGPEGRITQEVLPAGTHFVKVALNEVPLFIRKGACIPVADPAQTVAGIDPATIRMIGWPGASYDRYDDDGVTIPAE